MDAATDKAPRKKRHRTRKRKPRTDRNRAKVDKLFATNPLQLGTDVVHIDANNVSYTVDNEDSVLWNVQTQSPKFTSPTFEPDESLVENVSECAFGFNEAKESESVDGADIDNENLVDPFDDSDNEGDRFWKEQSQIPKVTSPTPEPDESPIKYVKHSDFGLEDEVEESEEENEATSEAKHAFTDRFQKYVDVSTSDSDYENFSCTGRNNKRATKKQAVEKIVPAKSKVKELPNWERDNTDPPICGLTIVLDPVSQFELDLVAEELEDHALMEKRADNPLMKVYPRLHTSYCTDVLTNREQQVKRIKGFITAAISPKSNANNRSIYISGVPGTGKTASVFRAIKEAQKLKQKFTYIYVNGLELVHPSDVFTEMYKVMDPKAKKTSAKVARSKLAMIFTTIDKKRLPVVLVVDELDMIVNQKQDIVYDIFDWAATDGSRLTVLAIANTLDLPERTLKQRVSSRLGFNREIFEPYGFEEIEEILLHRIGSGSEELFKPGFLQLISRKVAAVSGDLRKALELVRRGIEIAVDNDDIVLDTKHAQKVLKETEQSVPVVFAKSLSLHQEMFLRGILQEIRSSRFEEVDFHLVYRNYRTNCDNVSEEPMEMVDAGLIAVSLERCGFVQQKGDLVNRKITLNNSVDEVEDWLKEAKMNASG